MRLILGVSADGYLARGPNDDMRWLGPMDKKVFRVLTGIDGLLVVSKKTAEAMPSELPGRRLFPVSSSDPNLPDLEEAFLKYGSYAWLIGGPSLALLALKEGYIHETVLCVSDRLAFSGPVLSGAIKDEVTPFLKSKAIWRKKMETVFPEVTVHHWTCRHVS